MDLHQKEGLAVKLISLLDKKKGRKNSVAINSSKHRKSFSALWKRSLLFQSLRLFPRPFWPWCIGSKRPSKLGKISPKLVVFFPQVWGDGSFHKCLSCRHENPKLIPRALCKNAQHVSMHLPSNIEELEAGASKERLSQKKKIKKRPLKLNYSTHTYIH